MTGCLIVLIVYKLKTEATFYTGNMKHRVAGIEKSISFIFCP